MTILLGRLLHGGLTMRRAVGKKAADSIVDMDCLTRRTTARCWPSVSAQGIPNTETRLSKIEQD